MYIDLMNYKMHTIYISFNLSFNMHIKLKILLYISKLNFTLM